MTLQTPMSVAPSHKVEATGRAGTPKRRRRRSEPIGYLYVLPALAVATATILVPILGAIYLSFYRWNGISPGAWFGLRNYADTLSNGTIRYSFVHAAELILYWSILPVALALALIGIIARHQRIPGLRALRAVMFLPQVIPTVVIGTTWLALYNPSGGLLNGLLRTMGLGAIAQDWLGGFGTALPSIGLVGVWMDVGLCLILFVAGVSSIPATLYEAARVDGVGITGEFFAVTLPGLRRQVVVALTLTTVAALRSFTVIFVATDGGPGTATTVPALEIYTQAFDFGNVGLASATGVVLLLIILAVTIGISKLDNTDRE